MVGNDVGDAFSQAWNLSGRRAELETILPYSAHQAPTSMIATGLLAYELVEQNQKAQLCKHIPSSQNSLFDIVQSREVKTLYYSCIH